MSCWVGGFADCAEGEHEASAPSTSTHWRSANADRLEIANRRALLHNAKSPLRKHLALAWRLPFPPAYRFRHWPMMKIEMASDGETATLRISGQIDESHLAAIEAEVRRYRPRLVFDLAEATLVDRTVVQFLAAREAEGVELMNCPRYVREWIGRELSQ